MLFSAYPIPQFGIYPAISGAACSPQKYPASYRIYALGPEKSLPVREF